MFLDSFDLGYVPRMRERRAEPRRRGREGAHDPVPRLLRRHPVTTLQFIAVCILGMVGFVCSLGVILVIVARWADREIEHREVRRKLAAAQDLEECRRIWALSERAPHGR